MKNIKTQDDRLDGVMFNEDKLHEECGVFGITSPGSDNLAKNVYFGLHGLQHRGQESAGIASNMYGNITYHKDMGLVQEVFNDDIIRTLRGDICIGHVRYSTAGGGGAINAQPLVVYSKRGSLALAHNGNLTNAKMLRDELEDDGYIFQTTIDTETIAALVARNLKDGPVEDAIDKALNKVEGAYALVITTANKLIGVRDPNGLRPLCLGKLADDKGYVLSSESCTFPLQGAEFVRDIKPGEMVIIEENEVSSRMFRPGEPKRVCSFEYVYFARTDSRIDGKSVYESRIRAGELLAKEDDVEADLVIAVPDSGTAAAIGYSHGSGVPFGEGLVKNRYVGRTFIQPTQEMRELSVKMKLNVMEENIRGKSIVVIDDSVVRGTTSGKIVKMLRDAGAAKIHMRISSPPVSYSCYMGIDTPDRSNLMAANYSIDEMCEKMGADTLRFLSVEGLKESIGFGDDICTACFTGDYPVKLTDVNNKLTDHNEERSFVGEYD